MAVTDKLAELRRRADELRPWTLYDVTWPDKAEKAKLELAELRPQIEAEEQRIASLTPGLEREARLADEAAAVVSANQRMADASEAAARVSSDAARYAKWAAIFTAVAAAVTAFGTLVQVLKK